MLGSIQREALYNTKHDGRKGVRECFDMALAPRIMEGDRQGVAIKVVPFKQATHRPPNFPASFPVAATGTAAGRPLEESPSTRHGYPARECARG